ncbi:MAG: YMGG-like glycine zipper-containing protein [Polyangiaceae bacterium]
MKTRQGRARSKAEIKKRHEYEVEGGAGGAIAGAALGGLAGPPGIAVGAVIGAAMGAIVGAVTDDQSMSSIAEEKKLDRQLVSAKARPVRRS